MNQKAPAVELKRLLGGAMKEHKMSQPSGSKTIGTCPYCGEMYKLTNFMRRSKNLQHDEKGRWLWNTHLIACHRKSTPHNAENHARCSRRVDSLVGPTEN